jgi:hypothetical protein
MPAVKGQTSHGQPGWRSEELKGLFLFLALITPYWAALPAARDLLISLMKKPRQADHLR